jgi:hypothetical protein
MAKKRSKRGSKMAAARSKRRGKARAAATERKAQPKGMISAWEDDPAAGNQPSGGQVIQRPVPVLRDQPLPIRIVHPASAPEAKPRPVLPSFGTGLPPKHCGAARTCGGHCCPDCPGK